MVFVCKCFSYEDMQTTVALYLQMSLLFRQPEIDWGKLMQVRTMFMLGRVRSCHVRSGHVVYLDTVGLSIIYVDVKRWLEVH